MTPLKDFDQPRPTTRHGNRTTSASTHKSLPLGSVSSVGNRTSNGLKEEQAKRQDSAESNGDRKTSTGSMDVWSREEDSTTAATTTKESEPDEFTKKLMALADATNKKLEQLNRASEALTALENQGNQVAGQISRIQPATVKPFPTRKLSTTLESPEDERAEMEEKESPGSTAPPSSSTSFPKSPEERNEKPKSNFNPLPTSGTFSTFQEARSTAATPSTATRGLPRVATLAPKVYNPQPTRQSTTPGKAPSSAAIERLSRPRIRLDAEQKPLPLRSYSATVNGAGRRRGSQRPESTTVASLRGGMHGESEISHSQSLYNLWLKQKLESKREKARREKEKEDEEREV